MKHGTSDHHQFSLAGMKVGDWFMGCPSCWFQLGAGVAGVPCCSRCQARMLIYDIREKDRAEVEHHNRLRFEAHKKLAENRSEYS